MMGRGDNDTASKIMGGCLATLVVLSVILTSVFYCSVKRFSSPSVGASTLPYALEYMNIYACGTILSSSPLA